VIRCKSILVWIEFFCSGHRYADRSQAMQNTDRVRDRGENLVEPFVAIGRLVKSTAAQFDAGPVYPCAHYLSGYLPGTLAFAALAVLNTGSFLPTHYASCAVDDGVETVLSILVLYSFKDDGLIAHQAADKSFLSGKCRRRTFANNPQCFIAMPLLP
jgi:hypothetical protein